MQPLPVELVKTVVLHVLKWSLYASRLYYIQQHLEGVAMCTALPLAIRRSVTTLQTICISAA
jgi:hypothetical protein